MSPKTTASTELCRTSLDSITQRRVSCRARASVDRTQGYSGSQLWDTAFAVQALAATQLRDQLGDSLARAGSFLEATQV